MAEDELLEMPFLRNIGLIVTYRCQVACPHCIIEAGPHRCEEMQLDDALAWIDQIAAYRDGYIKVLSLTGGEPFYDVARLKVIADAGAARGLLVSAVTNAFWATSQQEAERVLREVSSIRMIALSTDAYHQQSIPFARVRNAIAAAQALNIPYNVAVCTEREDDPAYRAVLAQLHEIVHPDLINTAITFPVGRAAERIGLDRYQTSKTPPIAACSAGSAPIIFPDGRMIACIGPVIDLRHEHPLCYGNLREKTLAEILDAAEVNPILHTIRVRGPRKLISLLQEAGRNGLLPEWYIQDSVCHACYSLMSNPETVAWLGKLAADCAYREKVAYARLYYLRETRMLELMAEREGLQLRLSRGPS